jgi:RNA polymerase sigma factor (sigma-70 family)
MADGLLLDPERLLRHTHWLQHLARQLARDPQDADDAAQESWLRVLGRPPRDTHRLQGYLLATLRNVLRLGGRRTRRRQAREQTAAESAHVAAEPAADLVARFELHRLLVSRVLQLPEPQREAVLRHYFDGEAVANLALRLGTTADAVRSHLRRARERLRRELCDGEGPARQAFLLLLASPPPPTLLPLAVFAVATAKTKAWLGAAAVAILACVCWHVARLPEQVPPDSPLQEPPAPVAAPAPEDDRRSAPGAAGAERLPVPVASEARTVQCRLIGLLPAAPWTAPVQIDLEGKDEARNEWLENAQRPSPDADGRFVLTLPAWTATCASFAAKFRARDRLYLELDVREKAPDLARTRLLASEVYELPVQAVALITGRVVDFRGEPVPAARVLGMPWRNRRPGNPRPCTNTASDGSFTLEAPVAAEVLLVAVPMHEASLSGRRMVGRHGAIADSNQLRTELLPASARVTTAFGSETDAGTLTLAAAAAITGQVLDASGQPVPEVGFWWQPDHEWDVQEDDLWLFGVAGGRLVAGTERYVIGLVSNTDAAGRFVIHAPAGVMGTLAMSQPYQQTEPFVRPRQVAAPAQADFQLVDAAVLHVVRGGRPVPGIRVETDPEPGALEFGPNQARLSTDRNGEVRLLRDRVRPWRVTVRPPGLLPVQVDIPGDASPLRPIVVALPELPLAPITLDPESEIRVRQISGWFELLDRKASSISFSSFRNDGEGPFRLEAPPGRYRLHLIAPQKAERRDTFLLGVTQEIEVPAGGAALRVPMRHGGRIRFDVRDQSGAHPKGTATVDLPPGVRMRPVELGDGVSETPVNLPPGSHAVRLDLKGWPSQRLVVDVRACEVAEVRVTLP